jgi:hypothetical protein
MPGTFLVLNETGRWRSAGRFSTGIYWGLASSFESVFVFDLANHTGRLTNLLEVLHLSKLLANF